MGIYEEYVVGQWDQARHQWMIATKKLTEAFSEGEPVTAADVAAAVHATVLDGWWTAVTDLIDEQGVPAPDALATVRARARAELLAAPPGPPELFAVAFAHTRRRATQQFYADTAHLDPVTAQATAGR